MPLRQTKNCSSKPGRQENTKLNALGMLQTSRVSLPIVWGVHVH